MRISGLASGIDTESIIFDMMQVHRLPLNKITQKKQFLEWQLDDYRSVNRDIRSMRDNLFDMTRPSTFLAKTVTVSNENAVSIRSSSANAEFSGQIEIQQLAKAATWQSDAPANSNLNQNSTIGELLGSTTSITIQTPADENPIEITFDSEDTIRSVINKINKEANVNAFFDEHTGKIAMTAKQSGEGDIVVTGMSGNGQSGQNAKFTFNGLETERSSNTFDINGFEITLKETTSNPVTFSSAPDLDKVVDSIKKFVDDYNDLIKKLNDKIKEPLHRSYHPLSTEEKADMKEKEIELWEEKAMSGTLRNDPTIQSLLSKMRMNLMGSVDTSDGGKISLSDIGITTSSSYLDNGKLEINEDKLREAIAENPNNVYELFGRAGEGDEQGLVSRVRTSLGDANRAITDRAGNAGSTNESFILGRNLKEMNSQIERFEDRLQKMEERYWRQFSAMEVAMNRANAQAQQLQNALGGLMM